ncbi:MAG TPA: Slp family lipoprotein [Nitrospira sp.]|nr:Slp family lipoprotein [Nitrospira sp.]
MNAPIMARVLLLLTLCVTVGCTFVPRKYLRVAVPNLTFSALATTPQTYQNRLVVLGAVIVEEHMRDGDLWLHVKNRPLDETYRPQLPNSPNDSEGGWYWIVVKNHQSLPQSYHHWADMTLVGRVTGIEPDGQLRVQLIYARGWGMTSEHDGVWEHLVDENYGPTTPSELIRESDLFR